MDDWLLLYPPQVKHLLFQQKLTSKAKAIMTEVLLKRDDCLHLATAEAIDGMAITGYQSLKDLNDSLPVL